LRTGDDIPVSLNLYLCQGLLACHMHGDDLIKKMSYEDGISLRPPKIIFRFFGKSLFSPTVSGFGFADQPVNV